MRDSSTVSLRNVVQDETGNPTRANWFGRGLLAQQLSKFLLSSTFCIMKRRLVALKAYVSRNDRDKSETRPDWQSPAVDNVGVACQLLANLGSGVLVGVPGLQAAGQVAIQIIDIIKVRTMYMINTMLMNGP